MVFYRKFNIVPCATQEKLVVQHSKINLCVGHLTAGAGIPVCC